MSFVILEKYKTKHKWEGKPLKITTNHLNRKTTDEQTMNKNKLNNK